MDEEYLELQSILLEIIKANKRAPIKGDESLNAAESLAVKFYEHSASIVYLYKDTILPEINLRFFDLASLNIIARAMIETFLVFYYVFSEPSNYEQKEFRYLAYWISGLIERQNYPIESPQGKLILSNEKKVIDNIIGRLENNPYYTGLEEKHKERIIKRGEWRFKSWTDIALSAGLNKSNSKAFYKFLCGFAHSGSLTLQHIHQTVSKNEKIILFQATVSLLKIALANLILSYCAYFPKAQEYYSKLEERNYLVKLWKEVGATEMKDIEIDWSKLNK
jgi:hypothetical protein